jgi:hypothetical protein
MVKGQGNLEGKPIVFKDESFHAMSAMLPVIAFAGT